MSQPNSSSSQKNKEIADNGKQTPSTTKIMETCIFITELELSEGQRYVAKRKFIMSIVNSARDSSSVQQSNPRDAIPIPEPPPGTKSIWQRKRELEAETLINNAKPLAAIGTLQNRIIVLGIKRDKLELQVETLRRGKARLSTEVKRLDRINNFLNRRVETREIENSAQDQQIEKLKREYARLNTFQAMTIEESRGRQKLLDEQKTKMETMNAESNKEQSRLNDEIKDLHKAIGLLTTQLEEARKALALSSQQATGSSKDVSSQTNDQNNMGATADMQDAAHSSAEGQLLICRKRLESERQTAALAKKRHIEDHNKFTKTSVELQAKNDALTAELDKLKRDQRLLHMIIAESANTSSQSNTPDSTQTAANRAKINASAASTYVECRKLLEAQHAENTRLTTSNNDLRKELDAADRDKHFQKYAIFYKDKLIQDLKGLWQAETEKVVKLGAEIAALRKDLNAQTQEHATATEKLKKQLRQDRVTIEKSTKEIQEYKKTILKLQAPVEKSSTFHACIMLVFLVTVMTLLIMGFRHILFCP